MIPEDISYIKTVQSLCKSMHACFGRCSSRLRPGRCWWLFLAIIFPHPLTAQSAKEYSGNNEEQAGKALKSAIHYSGIRYTPPSGGDPFLNLQRLRKQPLSNDREISPRPISSGIAGTPIAELRFEGTSFNNDRRLAIVRSADGHACFLREGDRLFDGYLKAIQTDSIVLVRETKLSSGKILTQDVTRRLRKP
jgi:hypothetical protein